MSKYGTTLQSKESTISLHGGSKSVLGARSSNRMTQPANQQDGASLPATFSKDLSEKAKQRTQELAKSDENISALNIKTEQEDLK